MNVGEPNLITINSVESEIGEKRTNIITTHRSLFARKDFQRDDVIATFGARRTLAKPTYLTVQITETEHIELFPEYLECINHSCDPNCFFDTATKQLIALKPIKSGEEFGFFYPSAEWAMDQSFQCNCGHANCIGVIKGAKFLPVRTLKKYRFTAFIQHKLKEERGYITPIFYPKPVTRVQKRSQL